ncbi:MAG: hypothetical protein E2O77_01350 [Caldithrix sp.]|nr:MAG: hypothetical protein E2O77_01350 [Caldithrix sp.]
MLFKKRTILIGFLWLIASLSNRCLAQESNFLFISSLTDSLLDLATTQLTSEKASQAVLRSLEDNNINWFFEDRLVELLKRKNIAHIYFEDKVEGSRDSENLSLGFEYKVFKLDVKYMKQSRNSKRVKRIAEVEFFLRIIQHATGTVLLSENFEGKKEKWLHVNQANLQETSDIQFNPSQPKQKKINILQPILISSVTGIIVYLFYGLRSR